MILSRVEIMLAMLISRLRRLLGHREFRQTPRELSKVASRSTHQICDKTAVRVPLQTLRIQFLPFLPKSTLVTCEVMPSDGLIDWTGHNLPEQVRDSV